MRVIYKKNKIIYKYEKHKFSEGVITAIVLYIVSILLLIFSIFVSYLFYGEAATFIAGIGLSSIICNAGSMANIILEVYFYKNFHYEIRNLLILQILFFVVWIFLI